MSLVPTRTRTPVLAFAALFSLLLGVHAAPANAAGNHAAATYAAQAQRAGVSGPAAKTLQSEVDTVVANTHGRQTGPNTVAFRGGNVTVAVPGEKYARDLRTTYAPAAADHCPEENFCGYTKAAFTGTRYDFYTCTYYDTHTYLLYGGSWSDNQTLRRRVSMYGSSYSVIYTTPDAYSNDPDGDWLPVYGLKTCIAAK